MHKLVVYSCLLAGAVLALPFAVDSGALVVDHNSGVCGEPVMGWLACSHASNTSGVLVAHPRACHLFYYCSGVHGPQCRSCPSGLHFNSTSKVCDLPQNAGCDISHSKYTTADLRSITQSRNNDNEMWDYNSSSSSRILWERSGTNTGSGKNTGNGTNTGSGANSGSGTNTGSGANSGSGTNTGSGTNSGSGTNTGSGACSGSSNCTRSG